MSDLREQASALLSDESLDKAWRIAVKAETAALEFLDLADPKRAEAEGYEAMRAAILDALQPLFEQVARETAALMADCEVLGSQSESVGLFYGEQNADLRAKLTQAEAKYGHHCGDCTDPHCHGYEPADRSVTP